MAIHAHCAPRCAWPLLGRTVQFDSKTSVELALLWRPPPHWPLRRCRSCVLHAAFAIRGCGSIPPAAAPARKLQMCGAPPPLSFLKVNFCTWQFLMPKLREFSCQLLMPPFQELLHLPTSCANFSRSYFTCELIMPTFRELLHLRASHANFSRIVPTFRDTLYLPTSRGNFTCQLFENYFSHANFSRNTLSANLSWQLFEKLLHLPASHANFSRGTSPGNIACQLFESYFACQLLAPTFRELLRLPTSHANFSKVTSPAGFSRQLFESYFTRHLLVPTFRELLHLPASHANFSRVTSPANFSRQLFS